MTLDKRLGGIQTLKRKRKLISMEVLADGLLEIIQTIANLLRTVCHTTAHATCY